MTHIAIQEALSGKVVDWMEKVSDEEYEKVKLPPPYLHTVTELRDRPLS